MCSECRREEDPRDTILEASQALDGVVALLTESPGDVDKRSMEVLLRPLAERLVPAAIRVLDFRPPDWTPPPQ